MYIAFVDKVFWPDYCLEIFRILSSKLQREEELRRRVVGAVDKRQCKFSKLQSSRKVSIYYIVVYVHYVIFQERGITEFLRRQKCEKTEIVNDHSHCAFLREKKSFFQSANEQKVIKCSKSSYQLEKVPKGQKCRLGQC